MIVEVNYTLGYIEHHALENCMIINNYKGYYIITEKVANETWFNVYYDPNLEYTELEYEFSSLNFKDCLDYCGILYYDGEKYKS